MMPCSRDFRFGATIELGRSMMMMMMRPLRRRRVTAISYGVIDSRSENLQHLQWMSAACSLSDISGWRDGVLYPLARGCRRIWRGALRPARAAWVVQRLLAARW
jgi:hypothetical protein